MDERRIIETGVHGDRLDAGGTYRRLRNTQTVE
jgi:hypothetical protein